MTPYAGSASASSSSMATWNSRMSATSPRIVLIWLAISALAPSIAARSAAASCAGSSLAVRLATAAVSMVTGPMARPGEAARPVSWISVTLFDLAKAVMHQGQHGGERRLTVRAFDAKMHCRSLRRLHAHHLHGAFRICPGTVRRKRKFDLRGKALRKLRELDRGPRVKTDRINEKRRSRQWREGAGPVAADIMHRIPPRYA